MASVTKQGDSFLAQVRKKQKGVVVFSESRRFDNEKDAWTWADALEKTLGRDGIAQTTQRNVSVGDLVMMHLKHLQKVRNPGRSCLAVYHHAASEFDHIRLSDLKAKDIIDWALKKKVAGLAPSTIDGAISPISAAIHAAPHAHGIRVDPTEVQLAVKHLYEVGVLAKAREVVRLIDAEEEEALNKEFVRRNHHHQTEIDMTLVFPFALAFPRRAAELTRITWDDVNEKRKTVIIRNVKHPRQKIGNDQTVPILPPAWEILQRVPRIDQRIFPYDTESMLAAYERARNRIAESGLPSIKDLRFHDLRHSGITRLFWAGLQIQEVATISGHTNWKTLKRYTHIRPEDVHKKWFDLKELDKD